MKQPAQRLIFEGVWRGVGERSGVSFSPRHEGEFRWFLVDEDRMSQFFLPSVERFERLFDYVRTRDPVRSPFDLMEAAKLLLF